MKHYLMSKADVLKATGSKENSQENLNLEHLQFMKGLPERQPISQHSFFRTRHKVSASPL